MFLHIFTYLTVCSPFVFLCAERMRTLSPGEWAAILTRAKEKKAHEANVDPSATLKVRDSNPSTGKKRKRRTHMVKPVKTVKASSERAPVEEGESRDKGLMDAGDNSGPVLEEDKIGGESSHGGRVFPPPPSPLGDFFDAEDFIKSTFMLKGNLVRFESMEIRELRKLALSFEFKGMMLNYFLPARQESEAERASRAFEDQLNGLRRTLEASHCTSVEELVENHRSALDKTKAACEDRLRALEEVYAKDRAESEKRLMGLEKDMRNSIKIRNGLIVALVMAEDDASGFEEEVVELEENNVALKDALEEKYTEGYSAALEQIRVLFPDLDEATLGQADILKVVDGDKLSRVPDEGKAGDLPDSNTSPES
jgi:hypothetical protein